jgi:DNA-binding NtrC family response regulator
MTGMCAGVGACVRVVWRIGKHMKDNAPASRLDATGILHSDKAEAQKGWTVLIVSSRTENRDVLLHIFEGLPIHTSVARTLQEARAVFSGSSIDVVFCDESLPDGSYRALLEALAETEQRSIRFVVTLVTGEWHEYLEAMRLGATDVLRCPLQSIEVELVLIRAVRERDQRALTR